MMVLVGHLLTHPYWGAPPSWGVDFQNDAIVIFFVLSGVVIAYVTEPGKREHVFGSYMVARMARLWSVALPALALTFLFDAIGLALRPDAYWFPAPDAISILVNTLAGAVFVNQFYLFDKPFQPGSAIPYWSLSYEFAFYLLYGVAFLRRGAARWFWVAVIAYLAGYRIMLLMPTWLLGFYIWRLTKREYSLLTGWLLTIVSFILYQIMIWTGFSAWLGTWGDRELLGGLPLDWSRVLLWKYVLSLLIGAHILGIAAIARSISFGALAPLIRWAGSTTFTVYMLHFPLINMLNTVLPLPDAGGARPLVLGAIALPIMCALSWVFEAQRAPLRLRLGNVWRKVTGAPV